MRGPGRTRGAARGRCGETGARGPQSCYSVRCRSKARCLELARLTRVEALWTIPRTARTRRARWPIPTAFSTARVRANRSFHRPAIRRRASRCPRRPAGTCISSFAPKSSWPSIASGSPREALPGERGWTLGNLCACRAQRSPGRPSPEQWSRAARRDLPVWQQRTRRHHPTRRRCPARARTIRRSNRNLSTSTTRTRSRWRGIDRT